VDDARLTSGEPRWRHYAGEARKRQAAEIMSKYSLAS
jgi:hypothetical protein